MRRRGAGAGIAASAQGSTAATPHPAGSAGHPLPLGEGLRRAIVAEARAWIGTPYHHQASLKGVGCDCIGLVRGVWRAAIGTEPEAMPSYSRDWGEAAGAESLLALGRRNFLPVPIADMAPGDVVVFRMRGGRIAKHCGILTAAGRFVHAQERVPIAEVALSEWWRRRIVGAFRFPAANSLPSPSGGGSAGTSGVPDLPVLDGDIGNTRCRGDGEGSAAQGAPVPEDPLRPASPATSPTRGEGR